MQMKAKIKHSAADAGNNEGWQTAGPEGTVFKAQTILCGGREGE